jgi:hypothetical protein
MSKIRIESIKLMSVKISNGSVSFKILLLTLIEFTKSRILFAITIK